MSTQLPMINNLRMSAIECQGEGQSELSSLKVNTLPKKDCKIVGTIDGMLQTQKTMLIDIFITSNTSTKILEPTRSISSFTTVDHRQMHYQELLI
jgi:hypothetical protein